MKLLVIDEAYPSSTNLYADAFVHIRVKHYLSRDHDVKVAAGFSGRAGHDHFDGVDVERMAEVADLATVIEEWRPDAVLVHFPTFPFIRMLRDFPQQPVVAWIHGFEALGWYRRIFNLGRDPLQFARYVKGNIVQLLSLRRFIDRSNKGGPIALNFVSDWMRSVAERDTFMRVAHGSVIPNPIDDKIFKYMPKIADQRRKVLVIRPFKGRKYATDIITKAVESLIATGQFDQFEFTFAGGGVEASPLASLVAGKANVTLIDRFLTQHEIAVLHRSHGIFLCPTRQDAQGVSMCEAMSSGLVPISSRNTAIPEFIQEGISGLLCNNDPQEFADALGRLAREPALFERLSSQAAQLIRAKAGVDKVIDLELALVARTVARGSE